MTVMLYDSVESVQTTNSTTWDQIASVSGNLHAGEHWLWIYCEYGGTLTDKRVELQILINGSEGASTYQVPQESNMYIGWSPLGRITVISDETLYTIILNARVEDTLQTVGIRRIRLMVMKE